MFACRTEFCIIAYKIRMRFELNHFKEKEDDTHFQQTKHEQNSRTTLGLSAH